MQEITVIHVIDGEDTLYMGWKIDASTVMELDGGGISFSRYETITGDTVRIEDAVQTIDLAYRGVQDGVTLAALGRQVADMTLAEIGTILLNEKGRG